MATETIQTPGSETNGATGLSGTRRISYEEFLETCSETRIQEWVDGEVIELSPASDPHQELQMFLMAVLPHFVQRHQLGQLRAAPFQMRLRSRPSGREPDVMFVATANLQRITLNYLDGPADLAIEIISPDSRARDRGDKYYEYAEAGVLEYWVLDPVRRQAEFYQLEDGDFKPVLPDERHIYRSRSLPGLELNVDWLWPENRPELFEILQAWKLTGPL